MIIQHTFKIEVECSECNKLLNATYNHPVISVKPCKCEEKNEESNNCNAK